MIKSMTGYGQGKYEKDGKEYTVEIKAINHRYNDISIRLPRYFNFLEENVRKCVAANLSRGKIEVYISFRNMSDSCRNVKIDRTLVGMYLNELRSAATEYNLHDDITLTTLLKLPDIFVLENDADEDLYWRELSEALKVAINKINETRKSEGERLALDIQGRLDKILRRVDEVDKSSQKLLDEYKNKLINRVNELNANDIIDENRLGIEVVLFADKSSISEEVTRLRSHIEALNQIICTADGAVGKKIDFLIQEMNRETNTIGSKANSIGITNCVIEMKNEIENIREQVQNIE